MNVNEYNLWGRKVLLDNIMYQFKNQLQYYDMAAWLFFLWLLYDKNKTLGKIKLVKYQFFWVFKELTHFGNILGRFEGWIFLHVLYGSFNH